MAIGLSETPQPRQATPAKPLLLDVRARVGEKVHQGIFWERRERMSGLLATAKPYRIKAAHRRRGKVAAGRFVQRYYDPTLGRFLSVDPVTANGNTGGNFNRYWYANNNPYRFTDPDGRSSCADPACKTSTIDSVVPRSNSQPPPVNGTEGLSPSMAQNVDAGYSTTVTFQNDNPNGASPDQPLATKTANAVEDVISKSGVKSVNINSTTGGQHGSNSNHSKGRAVDINRVDGNKVNSANAGATRVQTTARQSSDIRENFGPTIMEKTTVPGGAAAAVTNQALINDHADHINLSGQQ